MKSIYFLCIYIYADKLQAGNICVEREGKQMDEIPHSHVETMQMKNGN